MRTSDPRLLDRPQLQQRITEEVERSRRHRHTFGLLLFEAVPGSDGLSVRTKLQAALDAMESVVRTSDVIARPYEDMLAVLLVETGAAGTHDALMRIRQRIADRAGTWRVTVMSYPEHGRTIAAMSFLEAA